MPRVAVSKEAAPAKVVTAASRLGQNIRTARKRRRLRQKDLATRAGIDVQTLRRVESGSLGTGIGAYIAVLWAMGLAGDVAQVAAPETDLEGKTLEAATRGERVRPSDTLPSDF
jgi:transcriptional regulator with XRE-family HTH domain